MELDGARDDLFVALVTAGSLVVLALGIRFLLDSNPSLYLKLTPLYVYLAYLITRNVGPRVRVDTARNWALATILVATLTFVLLGI